MALRALHVIFALALYSHTAQTRSVCDSGLCICGYNNKVSDFSGEIIDCSYNPDIFKVEDVLPNTAFTLDLSRNNLTSVQPSGLLKSSSLRELLLNRNQITELAPDALQLQALRRLDLSDNELEYIHPDTFTRIKELEYLNLANNRFTTFEKISFHHLGGLQEIVLDNNDLGQSLKDKNLFDRSGYGLTSKIETLSISRINLNHVRDNFFVDAYKLNKLIISDNNLKEVFEFPFTLQYLDLSDNPLTEVLGEDFADVPGLKELRLNNLMISEIPDYMFASLQGLTYLELERNKNLTKFSTFAFGQEVLDDADDFVLENLSLMGSRLTTLDKQLEVPFGRLVHLDLQGNPWKCDCKLLWLKKLQIQPIDYEHFRCATPTQLYNSKIFELDNKYFRCPTDRHQVGVAIAIISVCVLLASIALWIFLFVPKFQTRCTFIQNMFTPSTGYNALPVLRIS